MNKFLRIILGVLVSLIMLYIASIYPSRDAQEGIIDSSTDNKVVIILIYL